MIYLHRLLRRQNDNWTLKLFFELDKLKIGWSPHIREKLTEYSLEENVDVIKAKSRLQWKREVEAAVNTVNRKKLSNECYETKSGIAKAKTKTAFLIDKIDSDHYERKPMEPIQRLNRHETKVLISSRFHMLECGTNYKGTLLETCPACNVIDDEQHRLNYCTRFERTNFCNSANRVDFNDIFSTDFAVVKNALNHIEKVWNMKTGHGSMVQTF